MLICHQGGIPGPDMASPTAPRADLRREWLRPVLVVAGRNSLAVLGQLGVSTCMRQRSHSSKGGRSGHDELRLALPSRVVRTMPSEAREALERALCGVLERRYPGRRFAVKDQLDTLGHRATTSRAAASDADASKDAA